MEYRNLVTFVRASELRSFSAAARELGYSQSAVSMQISQLEEELDTRLFDRVGRSIALTQQGMRFLGYAQDILRMTQSAQQAMKHTPVISGQLRIAMAESVCMSIFPPVLTRYHELYPQVEVVVLTGDTSGMFRALSQNDVDLVYTLDDQIFRGDCVVAMSEPEQVLFVAPKGHPLAGRTGLQVRDCLGYPFILTEKGFSYRSQLDAFLAERSLEVTPFLEIGNTEVIARLVAGGQGLSLLPEFVVRERLQKGEVVRLDVTDFTAGLWRQVIYHKGKWISPAMQAFIDLLLPEK